MIVCDICRDQVHRGYKEDAEDMQHDLYGLEEGDFFYQHDLCYKCGQRVKNDFREARRKLFHKFQAEMSDSCNYFRNEFGGDGLPTK